MQSCYQIKLYCLAWHSCSTLISKPFEPNSYPISTLLLTNRRCRRQRSVMKTYSVLTTFILVGLIDDPNLQILLFIFLFITYLLSVIGNLTIITLTYTDSCLKIPMYFFLQNFFILKSLLPRLYSQIPVYACLWEQYSYL